LTVSGKGAVTVGELHDVTSLASYTVTSATAGTATADVSVEAIDETNKLATVTLSANRGAVDVNEIGATGVGTKAGTFSVTAYDEIDLNEAVYWNNADGSSITLTSTNKGGIFDASATNAGNVYNELGDLSATLSTGGKAEIVLHAGSSGTNFGVATVDATAVTGGAAITVNNFGDTTVTTETSAVTLGAAGTGKTNAVTVDGVTDVMNITGGSGKDTVAFAGTDDHMTSGTINLAGGSADAVDFANIVASLSATSEGVVVNLSNSAVTFDSGQTYSTSIAANTAAEYSDAGGTAKDVSTTDFSVVLSGVEVITGTANADYMVFGNTGGTFTGGAGIDTIVGGAGQDTIVLTSEATSDAVSSFTTGSGKDIIQIDVSAINGGDIVDSTGTAVDADTTEGFISYTVGATSAANAATANIIFVTNTTGINTISEVNTALGSDNITLDGGGTAVANTEGLAIVFYDATDGAATVGYIEDSAAATAGVFDGTGTTFVELASITMTTTEYAALDATNFAFI